MANLWRAQARKTNSDRCFNGCLLLLAPNQGVNWDMMAKTVFK